LVRRWNNESKLGSLFDEKANAQQREALNMIFSGKTGGFMAEFAKLIGEIRGIEYAPTKFEIADDLSHWGAQIPGKILAKAEALTGPTIPPGKRVQTINPPGSEAGLGESRLVEDHLLTRPMQWASNGKEKESQASISLLIRMVHKGCSISRPEYITSDQD